MPLRPPADSPRRGRARTALACCLAIALAGLAAVASAALVQAQSGAPGPAVKPPTHRPTEVLGPEDRPAARAAEPQSTAPALPRDTGPILRCWQFGRLVLEEPVAANPLAGAGTAVQVRGRGDARALQLIDLKNMACLIR